MSAIKLTVKKAPKNKKYDKGTSKFLGSPTLPSGYENMFGETVMFLMQIRLEEIKDLDTENLLPHEGYLYIFLDTAYGEYDLEPIVKYYKGEPTDLIDDFNSIVPEYEEYTDEYLISFSKCEDSAPGNKLFGVPSDYQYQEDGRKLLFQFDPLDSEMGLFSHIDGLFYFFFGQDREEFKDVELEEQYS